MQAIDRGAADSLIGWWLEAGVDVAVGEVAARLAAAGRPGRPPACAAPACRPQPNEAGRPWPAFQALAGDGAQPADGSARSDSRSCRTAAKTRKSMLLSDLPAREDAGGRQADRRRSLGADQQDAGRDRHCRPTRPMSPRCPASMPPAPGSTARSATPARPSPATISALASPKRLILFGDAPARALLGEPLARARGRVHRIEGIRDRSNLPSALAVAAALRQGARLARPVVADERE